MPNQSSDPEELARRLQNELLRMQLEEQFGGETHNLNPDLSAESEGGFLERVRDLEAGGPATYVAIGSLVSRKQLKRADAMARQGKFELAIAAVIHALQMAGIVTDDRPRPLPPPAYYRWLINDLFAHTIPAPPKGSVDGQDPSMRHAIGVMYAQVAGRQQREAQRN